MDWEMVSAIVDSIGAITVVISLVYLAMQVRIQNEEQRAASVHEISAGFRDTMSSLTDPALTALFVKGNSDYASLHDAERLQLTAYCMVAFKLYEEAFYQSRRGRLDEYIWEGMLAQLKDSMATDVLQNIWQVRRHQFGRDFRGFVDGLGRGEYRI